jgi:hypothetical protein
MIGYYISAAERSISPAEYTYKSMIRFLPGGITIGATFRNGDVLYADDEGLLHPATKAFRIRRRLDGMPMMSDGFLTGRDDHEATLPPSFTIAQLQAEIEWLTVEEALDWFRARVAEAAVTRRNLKTGETVVVADWRSMLRNMEGKRGGYKPKDVMGKL